MSTHEPNRKPSGRPSVAGKRTVHGSRSAGERPHASHAGRRPSPAHENARGEQSNRASGDGERFANQASNTTCPPSNQGSGESRPFADQNPGECPSPGLDAGSAAAKNATYTTPGTGYEPLFEESAKSVGRAMRRRRFLLRAGIAAAAVAVIVGGAAFAIYNAPITVSVNGTAVEIAGSKTVQAAFESAGEPASAGNLVDVEGVTIEEGGGYRFSFTVNGQPGTDPETKLSDGDVVVFSDGEDIEEESDVTEEAIPYEVTDEGHGPIHVMEDPGSDGVETTKTGKISGKTVTQTTTEPQDRLYLRYYPDTNGEKVIALTFDDGPWDTYTEEILDILKENGAKATFFTVGNRITGDGVDLVKREAAEGHQVCTHTWDHAAGSGQGVNLSYMSIDEQREEITKGLEVISTVTGQAASTVIRAPGGNFSTEVWSNVDDLITAEIGWDIDTQDWTRPGAEAIENALKNATPGDIILMHDGGGDRSQTVEALREALPYLKEQGYTFVTIDELMEYPMKDL